MTDPSGMTTHYEYNPAGQRTRIIANYVPGGAAADQNLTESLAYDYAGRLMQRTDPAGHSTTYAYDEFSRLSGVTNPLGHATTYGYDPMGNQLSVTDANTHVTAFEYDELGQVTRKVWPNGSDEVYTYDLRGNLTGHQLADNNWNTFTYNVLNQLVTANYFDGQNETYTYTPTGQLDTVVDSRGTTNYDYDYLDRPVLVTQPGGNSVAYSYDDVDNRTGMTVTVGATQQTTTYAYDGVNRLDTLTAPEGDVSTFAYNPVGQMTDLTTQRPGSNGVQAAYAYDGAHRLTAITHTNATSGALIQSYDYDLDLSGNRTHVLESDGINQQEYWWSYDAADRLISETYPDGGGGSITTTYIYDPVGNRLTETTGGQTTTYTYNNRDLYLPPKTRPQG